MLNFGFLDFGFDISLNFFRNCGFVFKSDFKLTSLILFFKPVSKPF